MISSEDKKRIISNNYKISELLMENEEILRKAGYKPPVNNYVVDDEEKIKWPTGYIRIKDAFYEKYHLREIVTKTSCRRNISYALQLSDFHNYIANRFCIWGSVETMFYKNSIINLVSIFEALILECANNICCRPSKCGENHVCSLRFNKLERNYVLEALDRLRQLGVLIFSCEEIERIKKIIGYRNRVHIRLAQNNEFMSDDFSLGLYNETILLLQRLCEDIYNNGTPLYNKCKSV